MKPKVQSEIIKSYELIEHLENIVQSSIDKQQPCFIPLIRKGDCAVVMNVDIYNALVQHKFRFTDDMAEALVKMVNEFDPDEFESNGVKQ